MPGGTIVDTCGGSGRERRLFPSTAHEWLKRYGETYDAAIEEWGVKYQTALNLKYMADRFEFSRRRENLSWGHHAEVAALDKRQQEKWLNLAEREGLSCGKLRAEDPKKWTQKRVAEALGVARETVRNWFSEDRTSNGREAKASKPDARLTIPKARWQGK